MCFENLQQLLDDYLDDQISRSDDQASTSSSDQSSVSDQSSSDQDAVLWGERSLMNYPLALSDMTYDLHQGFIQAFLQQTETELTDYFSSLNNAKIIETDEKIKEILKKINDIIEYRW